MTSPFQEEELVYRALRDSGDEYLIEFDSGDALTMRRQQNPETISGRFGLAGDEAQKPVVVVATKYNIYIFKFKNERVQKLYTRVSLAKTRVLAGNESITLQTEDAEEDVDLFGTPSAIRAVEVKLKTLAMKAAKAQLGARRMSRDRVVTVHGVGEGGLDEEGDASTSDDESPTGETQEKKNRPAAAAGKAPRPKLGRGAAPTKAEQRGSAARALEIGSLVDGEFSSNFAALREAFLRDEHHELLEDLKDFVADNEATVARLCSDHYTTFLEAAHRCEAIDASDAQTVRMEMHGAGKHIKHSVHDMKGSGAGLLQAVSSARHASSGHAALQRALRCAELLEDTERLVDKHELLSAVRSIDTLQQAVSTIPGTALGDYILKERVPSLTETVMEVAMQKVNDWLQFLRVAATEWGAALLNSAKKSSSSQRSVRFASPDSPYWFIVESDTIPVHNLAEENTQGGGGNPASTLARVLSGLTLQRVFNACGQADTFVSYYTQSRAKQFELDILAHKGDAHSLLPKALGFMLLEDLVAASTGPVTQTPVQLHTVWKAVCNAVAEACRRDTGSAAALVLPLSRFGGAAIDTAVSITIDATAVNAEVERLVNGEHASLIQDACTEVTEHISSDSFSPLSISSMAEFEAYASRYELHRLHDEMPIKRPSEETSATYVPYSRCIPAIGSSFMRFFDKATAIVPSMFANQFNDMGGMLQEYTAVIFRTALAVYNARLMTLDDRAVVEHSVCAANMTAMLGLLSWAEQRFMTFWHGNYGSRTQMLGKPLVFSDLADQMRSIRARCIERSTSGVLQHLDELLAPMATVEYWTSAVAGTTDATDSGLTTAISYCMATVPKLVVAMPSTMVESTIGSAVMHVAEKLAEVIEDAMRDNAMRDIVVAKKALYLFQETTDVAVDIWMEQLEAAGWGGGNAKQFPLDTAALVEELMAYLMEKEVRLAAEQAEQLQIIAGMEAAGIAVARGVADAGKATVKGVATAGKATVKGVASAGKVTKRGFFRFGRWGRKPAKETAAEAEGDAAEGEDHDHHVDGADVESEGHGPE